MGTLEAAIASIAGVTGITQRNGGEGSPLNPLKQVAYKWLPRSSPARRE